MPGLQKRISSLREIESIECAVRPVTPRPIHWKRAFPGGFGGLTSALVVFPALTRRYTLRMGSSNHHPDPIMIRLVIQSCAFESFPEINVGWVSFQPL